MKPLIVIVLLAVLAALAGAGLFMLRRDRQEGALPDKRMARALAMRVGLSIALFLFVLLAWRLGWLRPTGLPVTG